MYAVFENHGNQYRVKQGEVIFSNQISANLGSLIEFEKVLLLSKENQIVFGNPYIKGARILAKICNHIQKKKINIIKFSRRKHFKKKQGYRQKITSLKIINIVY
ncbi:MAG: 50S ribosomal protein L21 [Wigglesworthia glossinidia]|nr:50S ribosomal protein L21 [Wigglesworthia glossinidia]